jgi:hypothetical protein
MRCLLPVLLCLSTPALADPTPPDAAAITAAATPEFLYDLVNATAAGEQCEGFEVSPGEVALLGATAELMVAELKIDKETYDNDYYGLTYASIFINESCPVDGPKVRVTLDKVIAMGGVAG